MSKTIIRNVAAAVLSLAVYGSSVWAQEPAAPGNNGTAPTSTVTDTRGTRDRGDRGFDLGLIGLAGLLGLAGLMRKTQDSNRVTTGTTTRR
jgi:hypothetical protein